MRTSRLFICLIAIILPGFLPAPVLSASSDELALYTGFTPARTYQGRGMWSVNSDDVQIDLSEQWRATLPDGTEFGRVDVPFSWDNLEGRISMRRTFYLPDSLSTKSHRLIIDGFAQFIAVTLNGMNLDTRRGDGVSFQLDLDANLLHFGNTPNDIILELDNRLGYHNSSPLKGGLNARRRYGGIFGGIFLISSPALSVLDLQARLTNLASNGEGTIQAETVTRNRSRTQSITVSGCEITLLDCTGVIIGQEISGSYEVPTGGLIRRDFTLNNLKFRPWQMNRGADPYILRFKVWNATKNTSSSIILRSALISISDNGFVINNIPSRIRCVDYYEEYPKSGVPLNDEQMAVDISLIKALGANSVRIVQGCASLRFLEMCEGEGIVVFEELPVFQAPDLVLSEEEFIRSASEQLQALIYRDRRFACIAGWGIGSQINAPNAENILYYQQLTNLAHSLDDRPVYASIPIKESIKVAPLDFAVLELTPFSNISSYDQLPAQLVNDRPVLIGGIQRTIIPGNLGGYADPVSEGGQADYIVGRVIQAESLNWNAGVIVGSLNDWRSATPSVSGPLHGSSNLVTSGLTDEYRRPRLAFHRLQDYWTTGSLQPLPRGNASGSKSGVLIVVGMGLITVLLTAMKQNKLFRLNLARTFTSPRGFFQDIGESRYFQTGHTVLLTFLISGSFALIGSGWLHAYRYNFGLDWAISYLIGDPGVISWIASLIWHPLRSFIFFWGLTFVLIWFGAFRILMTCRIMGKRCSLSQGIDFLAWSSAGFVFVLPVSMVSERLFAGSFDWLVLILLVIAGIWSSFRLLSVLSHQVRHSTMSVALLFSSGPLIVTGLIVWFLESSRQLSLYWGFFWSTIIK